MAEMYLELQDAEKRAADLAVENGRLREALLAAKQHMWIDAAPCWTMADFKNWAIIQQIDDLLHPKAAALHEKGE